MIGINQSEESSVTEKVVKSRKQNEGGQRNIWILTRKQN